MTNQLLSIVVPCYNEQEVLPEFHRRLVLVLDSLSMETEVIYVNDGSTDRTAEILRSLCEVDARVGLLDLSRNFGKEVALTAGLDHARGHAVIPIDADLQDPPEVIPLLVARWLSGFDVVYATRRTRHGESWLKKATASLFYRLMQRVGERVQIPENTGDFRLMSRRALDALRTMREQHRFLKGLFAQVGFRQTSLVYDRDPRHAGTTKWNYWKLFNLSIEGITSFTIAPLKLASFVGIWVALLAIIYAGWIVYKTVRFGEPVAGYPSLMSAMLILGSVQLLALGVIGEYLGRVFNETKNRPLYFVQQWHEPAPSMSVSEGAVVTQIRRASGG